MSFKLPEEIRSRGPGEVVRVDAKFFQSSRSLNNEGRASRLFNAKSLIGHPRLRELLLVGRLINSGAAPRRAERDSILKLFLSYLNCVWVYGFALRLLCLEVERGHVPDAMRRTRVKVETGHCTLEDTYC